MSIGPGAGVGADDGIFRTMCVLRVQAYAGIVSAI